MMIKALSPSEVFARNLTLLRKMQGLSQEELAEKTDLTRQTVSKYEKGEADPNVSTLKRFAKAFEVPIDYFFKENSKFEDFNYGFKIKDFSSIKKVRYREAEKLDDDTEAAVKKEAFKKLNRLLEVERLVEGDIKFKNPVKNLSNINTREKAEVAALEVRKKWALYDNPFANVISVLEREGIKVIEVTTSPSFEGLSAEFYELPIIVLNDAIAEVTRKRFTALHELGHLILQIPDDISYETVERICDAFAAMLILPKELLIMELGEARTNLSINELNLIKQKYGISIRAILVSAGFAKIISWQKYKEICNHLEAEDICEYPNKERAVRFEQLLYRGVAERKIDQKVFAELSGSETMYNSITEI